MLISMLMEPSQLTPIHQYVSLFLSNLILSTQPISNTFKPSLSPVSHRKRPPLHLPSIPQAFDSQVRQLFLGFLFLHL